MDLVGSRRDWNTDLTKEPMEEMVDVDFIEDVDREGALSEKEVMMERGRVCLR